MDTPIQKDDTDFKGEEIIKRTEFEEIHASLVDWGQYVQDKLQLLLDRVFEKGVIQIPLKFRVKDVDSYIIKGLYRKKYNNPIKDIEDKVGIRIVALTTLDLEAIRKTIMGASELWKCKVGRDYRDQVNENPALFEYQSIHLIAAPLEEYTEHEDLKEKLTCEIQIRTLLQHAYAEISHDSAYKGPYRSDVQISRKLAMSMALMEATDDYFCGVFKMMTDPDRFMNNFQRELTKRYKAFRKDYVETPTKVDLDHTILSLLKQKSISLADIDRFIATEQQWISDGIRHTSGVLSGQPTILLVSYYLMYYDQFLRKEWPLSHESLDNLFRTFNLSDGVA